MAEINILGYENIRYHIQETWTRIVLKDGTGSVVRDLPINGNTVKWIHPTTSKVIGWDTLGKMIYGDVPSTDTLQLQIVVKGSDSGISLPVSFASSEVHNANGDQMTSNEPFSPFTMTNAEDKITVVHNIQVPKIV